MKTRSGLAASCPSHAGFVDHEASLLLGLGEAHLAQLFKSLRVNAYRFCVGSSTWYALQPSGRWRKETTRQPLDIRWDLFGTLSAYLKKRFGGTSDAGEDAGEGGGAKNSEGISRERMVGILLKLGSSAKLNAIFSFLPALYQFDGVMDSNPGLLAFNNVLVDLNKGGEVREIMPGDYISLSCGYNYPHTHDPTKRAFLLEKLLSLYPDQATLDSVLVGLAAALHGEPLLGDTFLWLKGAGGNGKTLLLELLATSLGDYHGALPSHYFTGSPTSPDATDSHLHSTMNSRIVVVSELPNQPMNAEILFKLTGGDSIATRTIGGLPHKWTPKFTIVFASNAALRFASLLEKFSALERRIVVVDHPHSFVAHPEGPHERLLDVDLRRTLKEEYHAEFMMLLLSVYRSFPRPLPSGHCGGLLRAAPCVKEATESYMRSLQSAPLALQVNPLLQWREENYEPSTGGAGPPPPPHQF